MHRIPWVEPRDQKFQSYGILLRQAWAKVNKQTKALPLSSAESKWFVWMVCCFTVRIALERALVHWACNLCLFAMLGRVFAFDAIGTFLVRIPPVHHMFVHHYNARIWEIHSNKMTSCNTLTKVGCTEVPKILLCNTLNYLKIVYP